MSGLGRDGEFQYLILLVPEESAYEVFIAQGRAQERDAVCVDKHLRVKFKRYEVKQVAVDKDVGFSGHRANINHGQLFSKYSKDLCC